MSLFPDKDILPKEISSWEGFADSLRGEDRELFGRMLAGCYRYAAAVNAKGEPFPAEALLMAVMFSQQKTISRLAEHIKKIEGKKP
jgi:hypothetical protein